MLNMVKKLMDIKQNPQDVDASSKAPTSEHLPLPPRICNHGFGRGEPFDMKSLDISVWARLKSWFSAKFLGE
ncbi:hypothetical protein AN401_04030 [Zobellella denitrificans]|uniref:Uncharacterized protein n=1 Tax=Zobellella denitrificans TaxID=347534 RepID=A0A291HLZ9_9GAMM|nr:hypothetical protein AN401_04030 [Zobellella denitrificans]